MLSASPLSVFTMSDIARDIRLAVDTGKVALGTNEVVKAINSNGAKLVIVAGKGRKDILEDISHACTIANVKFIKFSQGSMELGTVCGKPYPINSVAVIEPGNSNILNEEYA